ncbi:MAG: TSUP family transporter, partial [Solirubrobacteraceae bacterium]
KILAEHRPHGRDKPGPFVLLGVLLGGVYGGYFGAAQGIMVLAILSVSLDDELQRLNAVKVILTGLVNLVSGIVFIFAAHVAWGPAGLIAGGSLLGGVIGARAGRRLSPTALRGIIVVVGITAIVRLLA